MVVSSATVPPAASHHAPTGGHTLAMLAKGQSATIVALRPGETAAVTDHVERLMELGFLPGERVRIVAKGFPSGDPIAVRIGLATFALRRFEADLVEVSLMAEAR